MREHDLRNLAVVAFPPPPDFRFRSLNLEHNTPFGIWNGTGRAPRSLWSPWSPPSLFRFSDGKYCPKQLCGGGLTPHTQSPESRSSALFRCAFMALESRKRVTHNFLQGGDERSTIACTILCRSRRREALLSFTVTKRTKEIFGVCASAFHRFS